MTDKKKFVFTEEHRIQMVQAEGWKTQFVEGWGTLWVDASGAPSHRLPTYDNDNDLDRYIRGMSDEQQFQYAKALRKIVGIENLGWQCVEPLLTATVEQKREAIVKAEGWE